MFQPLHKFINPILCNSRKWKSTSVDVFIKRVTARMILDSRGNPTIEVDLLTSEGKSFRAAVPSGASTGAHEAVELRDKGKDYRGLGVEKAVEKVKNVIGNKIKRKNFKVTEQEAIDNFLIETDGTPNKGKLGANSMLGVSMAVCKAGADAKQMPLYKYIAQISDSPGLIMPVPAFNVINGGKHAGNNLAFQELMIFPIGASSITEALKIGTDVYHTLKKQIEKKYSKSDTSVGDEGGFAPNISTAEEGLSLISDAIAEAGHKDKVSIAMDVAATEFYKDASYNLQFKDNEQTGEEMSAQQLLENYQQLIDKYPIVSIEDPFAEDDWEAWSNMTREVNIQIVGDDLTVTNPDRIKKAIENQACNALLLKVNQIGTVTEAIKAHQLALENCWGTMVSHRSGETCDSFISDLAVGLGAGMIKAGAPCRSERTEKYNQLLRIEEGRKIKYAGKKYKNPFY